MTNNTKKRIAILIILSAILTGALASVRNNSIGESRDVKVAFERSLDAPRGSTLTGNGKYITSDGTRHDAYPTKISGYKYIGARKYTREK